MSFILKYNQGIEFINSDDIRYNSNEDNKNLTTVLAELQNTTDFNSVKVVTSRDDVAYYNHDSLDGILQPMLANSYILEPNTFYAIDNWKHVQSPLLDFHFNLDNGVYAGRFTAWQDNMTVTWPKGIKIPDNMDIDIVANHTYEFNVWQGVLLLIDVTSTTTDQTITDENV